MKSGDLVVFKRLDPCGRDVFGNASVSGVPVLILDDDEPAGAGAILVELVESSWMTDGSLWVTPSAARKLGEMRSKVDWWGGWGRDEGTGYLEELCAALEVRSAIIGGMGSRQQIVFYRKERCTKLGSQRAGKRSERKNLSKSETQSTI